MVVVGAVVDGTVGYVATVVVVVGDAVVVGGAVVGGAVVVVGMGAGATVVVVDVDVDVVVVVVAGTVVVVGRRPVVVVVSGSSMVVVVVVSSTTRSTAAGERTTSDEIAGSATALATTVAAPAAATPAPAMVPDVSEANCVGSWTIAPRGPRTARFVRIPTSRNARTTAGSNWLPAWSTSSWRAAAGAIATIAAFTLFDGIQGTLVGAMRGYGETRISLINQIVSFWIIAIPVSLTLAFGAGFGLTGLIYGLGAGMTAAALLNGISFYRVTRRPLQRA